MNLKTTENRKFTSYAFGKCISSIGIHRAQVSLSVYWWGSIPGRGRDCISSLPRPDRLWGPPFLLPSGYRRLYPRL